MIPMSLVSEPCLTSIVTREVITTVDMNLGRYVITCSALRAMLERISLKNRARMIGMGKPKHRP